MVPQLTIGSVVTLAGWLALRRDARSAILTSHPPFLLLDMLPVAGTWLVLTCLTGRPILSAIIVAAASFGMVKGSGAKRAASSEPLVFTDAVLGSIFFYPSLYAEFVTPPALILALTVTASLFAVLGWLEPRLLQPAWPGVLVAGAAVAAACLVPVHRTVLRLLARPQAPPVTGLPELDSATFGPLASLVVHTVVARAERPQRRQNRAPQRSDSLPVSFSPNGPVVMLQLESFFDARRLGEFVPRTLLPHYDRCVAGSIRHGHFATPAYGANTVRTEFAALTGLPESVLGLDRYNPYAAYALVPIDSIAWRLRAAGFHTICLHPFAGTFYGRRRVIPNLGFDEFLDIGAFAQDKPAGCYMSDLTVVRKIGQLLQQHGPRTFIFAMTMGNHSPWQRPALGRLPALPHAEAFGKFLAGLAETDAALGGMTDILRRDWPQGLLAAFGDHLPSFPRLYSALGQHDRATDYVIWQPDSAFGERLDIRADQLPGQVLRAAEPALSSARVRRILS